jgi:hypothetical protein
VCVCVCVCDKKIHDNSENMKSRSSVKQYFARRIKQNIRKMYEHKIIMQQQLYETCVVTQIVA